MVRAFSKLIQPYARRIRLTVSRGIVRLVKDALKLQEVQISLLADETRDQVERFQNYGLTSVPLPGAEGIFLSVGGSRDHGIVIAVDDRRYRLKGLKEGEVALYTDEGDTIHFKRDRIIEITGGEKIVATTKIAVVTATDSVTVTSPEVTVKAETKVTIDTPATHCTGTLQVDGKITGGSDIEAAGNVADAGGAKTMAGMRGVFNGDIRTDPQGGMVPPSQEM